MPIDKTLKGKITFKFLNTSFPALFGGVDLRWSPGPVRLGTVHFFMGWGGGGGVGGGVWGSVIWKLYDPPASSNDPFLGITPPPLRKKLYQSWCFTVYCKKLKEEEECSILPISTKVATTF